MFMMISCTVGPQTAKNSGNYVILCITSLVTLYMRERKL